MLDELNKSTLICNYNLVQACDTKEGIIKTKRLNLFRHNITKESREKGIKQMGPY